MSPGGQQVLQPRAVPLPRPPAELPYRLCLQQGTDPAFATLQTTSEPATRHSVRHRSVAESVAHSGSKSSKSSSSVQDCDHNLLPAFVRMKPEALTAGSVGPIRTNVTPAGSLSSVPHPSRGLARHYGKFGQLTCSGTSHRSSCEVRAVGRISRATVVCCGQQLFNSGVRDPPRDVTRGSVTRPRGFSRGPVVGHVPSATEYLRKRESRRTSKRQLGRGRGRGSRRGARQVRRRRRGRGRWRW